MIWPERLELEPLLEARFDIDKEILDVGVGAFGSRRILRCRNGTCNFIGGGLNGYEGKVLDGSADYALYNPTEEFVLIDVRAVVEVDLRSNGKLHLYVNYANEVRLDQEMRDRLKRSGGELSYARSNFIVQPRIEVGVPQQVRNPEAIRDFQRLTYTRIVAHAQLTPLKIEYRMYEVVNRTARNS